MNADPENASLGSLFAAASAAARHADDTDSPSDAKAAVAAMAECARRLESLAIFSTNEILEDIATPDLKLILIDAYLGELTLKLANDDRMALLLTAENHLKAYLNRLDTLGILSAADKQLIKLELENLKLTPDARRLEKIAQFKREKATRARLDELTNLLASKEKTQSGNKVASSEEDLDVDDAERELVLATASLMAQKAVGSLRMIKEERPMLQERERRRRDAEARATSQSSNAAGSSSADDRIEAVAGGMRRLADLTGPLMDQQGRPMRPFVITSKREQLQQGVFRPGHNLPTMTVDEYLQREMERGNFLSGGTERPDKAVAADEDEAAIESERQKAVEWDAFRDENLRGWGNRHNKG